MSKVSVEAFKLKIQVSEWNAMLLYKKQNGKQPLFFDDFGRSLNQKRNSETACAHSRFWPSFTYFDNFQIV